MNWYPAEESDDERADRMGRPLSNLVISTPGLGPAPEAAPQGVASIERDEEMDRTYIPMPGGWEVQTQGTGSSFRLCDTKTGERWIIIDKRVHKALEQMARDANAAAQTGGTT